MEGRCSLARSPRLGSSNIAGDPTRAGSCTRGPGHGHARRWQHGQYTSASPACSAAGSRSRHPAVPRRSQPHTPVPCGTVLLAVRHNPAAAGRGARLGWVQCSLAPLTVRAPLNPHLLPDWGGLIPRLPSRLPAPDLGVSRPQGPSVPALVLLIDRAGGRWAGTPCPRPFISSAVGLHHISCRCMRAPSSRHRAAATCVPAIPAATLPAWPCRLAATPVGPEPLVPQPRQAAGQGLCPHPRTALGALAVLPRCPLKVWAPTEPPNAIPKVSASCRSKAPAWRGETHAPSTPRDPACPRGWVPPARSQRPPQSGSGVLPSSPSCAQRGGATSA